MRASERTRVFDGAGAVWVPAGRALETAEGVLAMEIDGRMLADAAWGAAEREGRMVPGRAEERPEVRAWERDAEPGTEEPPAKAPPAAPAFDP